MFSLLEGLVLSMPHKSKARVRVFSSAASLAHMGHSYLGGATPPPPPPAPPRRHSHSNALLPLPRWLPKRHGFMNPAKNLNELDDTLPGST